MEDFYSPRSTFDPAMSGQVTNFHQIGNVSTLQGHISKSSNRSEMKPSPNYPLFHSEYNFILLLYHYGIVVIPIYSILEGRLHTLEKDQVRAN